VSDKRKAKPKGRDKFAKVPLWWAEQAAQATGTQAALVWILLLHLSWEANNSKTFKVPNKRLAGFGISRKVKARVLHQLERVGLIQVAREHGKNPIVTLRYVT
jgi:hypothetical protein